MRKAETSAEKCILYDSLLFKLVTMQGKETALLGIPGICADKIITLYHSSFFCRTSRCNKYIFNYRGYFLYTRSNTPLEIIYKRISHMPSIKK